MNELLIGFSAKTNRNIAKVPNSQRLSPALRGMLDRYRDRLRHARRIQRSHSLRKHRTWTQACQANLTKLRYRHANQYARQTPDPWTNLISAQIEKFANRIDVVNAWHRREFFILEKMNAGIFRQELIGVHGPVWACIADTQIIKATRLAKQARRIQAARKYWSQVLLAGYGRMRKTKPTQPDHWVSGIVTRARKIQERDAWCSTIWNGFRGLWSSRVPPC